MELVVLPQRGFQMGITNHHRMVGLLRDMQDGNRKLTGDGRGTVSLASGKAAQSCALPQKSNEENKSIKVSSPFSIALSAQGREAKHTPRPSLRGVLLPTWENPIPGAGQPPRRYSLLAGVFFRRVCFSLRNQGWDCPWQGEITKEKIYSR